MKEHTIPAQGKVRIALMAVFFLFLFNLSAAPAFSISLKIKQIDTVGILKKKNRKPGQIPHSRLAEGVNDIRYAWLSAPTDRYQHAVLGDSLEAGQLTVETTDGRTLQVSLPADRVFEDLEPRLVDLDGNGRDEIVVVESEVRNGASLAVYGITAGRLTKIAATPFLGRSYRWLNPLGTGDFDGDGRLDIALVATPHIGGILRLYRYQNQNLELFAEFRGVSTHRIGSTELGLGKVIKDSPVDLLLIPNQSHLSYKLLEWTPKGIREITRIRLPGRPASSLLQHKRNSWIFKLENGQFVEIQVDR